MLQCWNEKHSNPPPLQLNKSFDSQEFWSRDFGQGGKTEKLLPASSDKRRTAKDHITA